MKISNIKPLLYILLIILIYGCGSLKKNSETFISQQDSISYALPSENLIRLNNLCYTINFGPVLSHSSGPVKVDVKTVGRGSVEILTKYDTIFKEKTKEVIKTVTKNQVKYRTNWKWILGALVIGFALGYLRPWRVLRQGI